MREQRISGLVQLGLAMNTLANAPHWPGYESGISETEFDQFRAAELLASHKNGWFTIPEIRRALIHWSISLASEKVHRWMSVYGQTHHAKRVGIICAGNIPMVGLHDVICVLMSGHHAIIRLSSADDILIPAVIKVWQSFDPEIIPFCEWVYGTLPPTDAVIATGSNNTLRYFEYYFSKKPHVFRGNRTSVAVLSGQESDEELNELGNDIFAYFGLGCRSISKVFLPKDYDLQKIFAALYSYREIANHNKYANNYDYHRALWMMNSESILENGFVILRESEALHSPVATLYYEYYTSADDLDNKLKEIKPMLQCVVGRGHFPFGSSQSPELSDYADECDTMAFCLSL
jgi:hypothetical protein